MGTDIGLHFEKRNPSGKWEKIEIPGNLMPDERHYTLFSFLADVRTAESFEFAGQIKGRIIPEDCVIAEDISPCPTYAYLDEILRLPWKEAQLQDCYFYIFCRDILPKLVKGYGYFNDMEMRDIRVIIWFDF